MEKKYFFSEPIELQRSEIHFAEYNPRKMTDEARKLLKKSIKKYGVVGGIVVNKQTGNTIVGGHQKVMILDELNKYNDGENDYFLRVEMVDVDLSTEKSLNVTLNNMNLTGTWDYDKLRELIPDIDYKDAGLTEADLSFIGVDFILQTEQENNLADQLNDLMYEVNQDHKEEVAQRKEEREAQKAAEKAAKEEMTYEEKKQHMIDVKNQVKDGAIKKAQDMDAYIMLSFDSYEAKEAFLISYGYDPTMKFIKGEDFETRCEPIMMDDEEE